MHAFRVLRVAFTPKGGCPLKRRCKDTVGAWCSNGCSIHPQGWVPIETHMWDEHLKRRYKSQVAFTPKGGCPLKPIEVGEIVPRFVNPVAFTPKGGCQLKRCAKRACLVEVLLW